MSKMKIYEPAMCCSTGVCGVSPDEELMRVSTVVEKLLKNGADIKRYNLSNAPQEFVDNKKINDILNEQGENELPIILVDEQVVITGRYTSNEEFSKYLNLEIKDEKSTNDSCGCGSSSSCC